MYIVGTNFATGQQSYVTRSRTSAPIGSFAVANTGGWQSLADGAGRR
jgi:hypothetical protein